MIVGIDLGTTNSLVSAWTDNGIKLIPNEFGEYLTPSVVSFDENGEAIVGKIAKERLITHPESTVSEFKRQMGRDVTYRCRGAEELTPVDLSALVIKKLVSNAEEKLGEKVDSAVISVPAYFDDHQREATRIAGLKAGIKVTQLVNEPSAAALAYHVQHIDQDEKFIVFDFGGGTLDVTVVEAFDNMVEITNISGDNALGGKDFNEAIAIDMCGKIGADWSLLTKKDRSILVSCAEALKIKLSTESEVSSTVNLGGNSYLYSLDRQGLIDISGPVFKRHTLVLKRLMNDSMLTPDDIDGVIMVGGSSKMPIVKAYLESLFPGKVHVEITGDVAICQGAGIVTGIALRKEAVKDIVMTDICPFSLGIMVVGDRMSTIIPKNQTLPASKVSRYYTVNNMQSRITIDVYQGERLKASDNLLLDSFEIEVPKLPKGEAFCDVRFSYDLNGIFDIDVHCPLNNLEVHRRRGAQEGVDEDTMARIRRDMEELKLNPYEVPEIKFLLEKSGRMFEEGNELQRRELEERIRWFTSVLDEKPIPECRKAAVEFALILDQIENSMFSFEVEKENLWNELFEENKDT